MFKNNLKENIKLLHEFVHESNLIESIDDVREDLKSLNALMRLLNEPRVTEKVLLELHKNITKNQLGENESGHYRNVSVMVGGRLCPAPFIARELTYNFLMDLMKHSDTLSPKEMHIRFEKIHPFVDGNGRTGRMLMWWHEMQKREVLTMIKFKDREAYYDWFRT